MNENERPRSNATGCAIAYAVFAYILIKISVNSLIPGWAQSSARVLLIVGTILAVVVGLIYLIDRWLGLSAYYTRGEIPMGYVGLLIRFYIPYLRWRGYYKKFGRQEGEVEDLIRRAAEEGATELNLNSNLLESLPEGLSELTGLKSLSLYENVLISISGIGQLTNLESLLLSDNSLAALPPEFTNLKRLTDLHLSKNALETFPPAILKLTKLRELAVDGNILREIPSAIRNLKRLELLHVGSNELDELPPAIGELTNLTSLAADYNHLKSLPAEIGNLTELKDLFISDNELTSIPPEIGKLVKLEVLNLAHNPLTSLPPEVLALPETVVFVVDKEQAEAIPELKDRPNVKILDY